MSFVPSKIRKILKSRKTFSKPLADINPFPPKILFKNMQDILIKLDFLKEKLTQAYLNGLIGYIPKFNERNGKNKNEVQGTTV